MKIKEWAAFIALGLIWGSSFLWIKIALHEIGPFFLVALRLLLAILCLATVTFFTKPAWPIDKKTYLHLFVLGITNNGLPYLLISWGEQHIDSAVAAILNSTVPLFTMIIAHFLTTDDRMTKSRLVGLVAGFLGVVVLLSRDLFGGFQATLFGQAAVLFAALSYAFSTIYARRTTINVSPVVRAMLPLVGADLLLWFISPIAESPLHLPSQALTWVSVTWLGILGVGVAYMIYFYLLHAIGPTRTTLVSYVFPVVGVLLGIIFLKERFDWNLIVGTLMIIGSIFIINRR
jgi:drug/metabolite transporter (DMT)-like permease